MELIMYSLALLVSFYLLGRVCDKYFVGSLDKIAKDLKLSNDAAGATLMAVGSSAPELFVAFIALIKPGDHEAVGIGTIVGSAIFNILVIIGAAAIVVKKTKLLWQPIVRDTLFYSASILLLIFSFRDGIINLTEALIFLGVYILYVLAVVKWRKISPYKEPEFAELVEKEIEKAEKSTLGKITAPLDAVLDKFFPNIKHYYWIFFISIMVIAALSYVLVESAVGISVILNIPAAIIALTVLAAGTSIPDLLSSIIVAKQGRGDMAISNAIGSNIFDILFGLGFPWLLVMLFMESKDVIEVTTENLFSSVVLLFATVVMILFLLISHKWKIGYRAGYFLVFLYVAYVGWAIGESFMWW